MHRQGSLEPYARHFKGQELLELLEVVQNETGETQVKVQDSSIHKVLPILKMYETVKSEGRLIKIPFVNLPDYLWLLKGAAEVFSKAGENVMLYLAAAVSDFYIPPNEMSEHKIQSRDGALVISLHLVPKILQPLVNAWVPNAFVISFKLETDESILISKARAALEKYKHKLVIGNILQTRKQRVVMVTTDSSYDLIVTPDEMKAGLEIDKKIVDEVVNLHELFIKGTF